MKKFTIAIEETIVQEFEIFAEDLDDAMKKAQIKYDNGEIVLDSGECQFKQMAVTKADGKVTEWIEF